MTHLTYEEHEYKDVKTCQYCGNEEKFCECEKEGFEERDNDY